MQTMLFSEPSSRFVTAYFGCNPETSDVDKHNQLLDPDSTPLHCLTKCITILECSQQAAFPSQKAACSRRQYLGMFSADGVLIPSDTNNITPAVVKPQPMAPVALIFA